MTDVQWLWSISSNESEQLRLLKKLMNLFLQKSVARATEGRHALTYQEILSLVKEVAMEEGKPECMIKQGSVWENRKPLQMAQDVNTGNNNGGGGFTPGGKKPKQSRRDKKDKSSKASNPGAGELYT